MDDRFWEDAAQRDPLWAILSDPTKRGRRWELRAFFETGRREISLLLYQLRQLGRLPRPGRALDFGCGVGRLTQALAATFADVVGVDVSPTMIELAQQLNRHRETVRYVLNQSPALEQFPSGSFDLVYSDIVLQHLEPAAAQRYITELLRVLSPGGVAVFQLPSHKRTALEQRPRPVNMAPDAYRARLRIIDDVPALTPAATALVLVEVHNVAPLSWNQAVTGTIRLGNHWRNSDGEMLIQDDGRTALPTVTSAGASVRLVIGINAPPDPGTFVCEFDLVHEGISWFGDLGSTTVRMPVVVAVSAQDETHAIPGHGLADPKPEEPDFPDIYADLRPDGTAEIPPFPMHGVRRDTVIELIRKHEGEPFFIEEDERGGPEWLGYRYFVSKT